MKHHRRYFLLVLIPTALFYGPAAVGGDDFDKDGVPDDLDNCLLTFNPAQRDSDADNLGNACDADFNNDCVVNIFDVGEIKDNFFVPGDTEFDLNGDDATNFLDLGILKAFFALPPGPSGLPNVCSDTTAPSVNIVSPEAGATVAGNLVFSATATDNFAVASVRFFVDDIFLASDQTPDGSVYSIVWDSTLTANGPRALTALAYDENGNIGSSPPVNVNVDNPDFGPFGEPMYVRGAFVDDPDFQFGTEHTLVSLGSGQYEANLIIDRSVEPPTEFLIGFKVADADWTEGTNCGFPTGAPPFISLDQPSEIVCSAANNGGNPPVNVSINLLGKPQPGDYKFTIDASDFPEGNPTVTVTLND